MKKQILFVYTSFNTFVSVDYKILSSKYTVDKYEFQANRKLGTMFIQLLKQLAFLILNLKKYDAVYVWFGDYHSVLPIVFSRIYRKQSYVVVGGYDVANFPEYKYGSLVNPFRRFATYYSFKYASLCLPVVEKLQEKLHAFCPGARSRIIHTGYQFNNLDLPNFTSIRNNNVVTVSITSGSQRFYIKGLDRFRELALHVPDFNFIVIGVSDVAQQLFQPIPYNLKLLPVMNYQEVTKYYREASFYAQFSRTEGLPNALCEGMLYGCIPLGLDIGGIPTAIEDYGIILKDWNAAEIADYMHKTHNALDRQAISDHILRKFDISYRITRLNEVMATEPYSPTINLKPLVPQF
ncbi:glycosyltransferase [Maribellus sediminis]|uniref:glycosyltransferase n=1 Tax=Maribellus sediminis TaxID=2696285 RepID=UPI001430E938|nr:glycosyltransferase [Maribellus sediminis]